MGDGNNEYSIAAALELAGDIDDAIRGSSITPSTPVPTPATKPRAQRGRPPKEGIPIPIDDAWEADEQVLEAQISDMINDPHTFEITQALSISAAEKRAQTHAAHIRQQQPRQDVSMAETVEEDEFADDPEVQNCVLSPAEAQQKESIWVNNNKDWLRQQQEKIFRQMVEKERPKATRNRTKKPRIGEGQTSPASTPAEAAIKVAKERGFSRRINYDAIRQIFEDGNGNGQSPTSAMNSVGPGLGSIFEDKETPPPEDGAQAEDEDEEEAGGDAEEDYEFTGQGEYGEFEAPEGLDPEWDTDRYDHDEEE